MLALDRTPLVAEFDVVRGRCTDAPPSDDELERAAAKREVRAASEAGSPTRSRGLRGRACSG